MGFWLYAERATAGGMALIRALRGRRVRVGSRTFRPGKWRKIINWGNKEVPAGYNRFYPVLNKPELVAVCIDKSKFFNTLAATCKDYLPPFTDKKDEAQAWVEAGKLVVSRTILNGHSGKGIVLCSRKNGVALPECKLHTLYVRKDEEYRVHILRPRRNGNEVVPFYVQKKVKRKDFEGEPNRKVRCFDNGYTYQHDNLEVPDVVKETAAKVFMASGLDFGAVDVIFVRKDNKAYVLEINTAPGLEGTSVDVYAQTFNKYF